MRALLCLASFGCVLFGLSAAAQMNTTYTLVEVATQQRVRINYFATFNMTCKPASAPTISVIQEPKFGALIIRRSGLVTTKIAACPILKTPVAVIYYRSRIGYRGPDHLVYSVTSQNGLVTNHDITISVKGQADKTHSIITGTPI